MQIANPGERIKPGMFARVSIDLGAQQNVVVPDRAVVKQSGSGNKYVYVLSDGRVSYRKVTLGQRFDTTYELLDGIEDGDTVVITGQTRVLPTALLWKCTDVTLEILIKQSLNSLTPDKK